MVHSLWSISAGDSCYIAGFSDTLQETYKVRLMDLGFFTGEYISCLQSPAFGAPKLYRVNNTVFSLDEEVAERIFIRRLD